MNTLYQQLIDWWNQQKGLWAIRRQRKRFERACKLADELLKKDHKTRYVIERRGGFTILSTEDMDHLKRTGEWRKGATIYDLLKKSSYVATLSSRLKQEWNREKKH